MCVCVCLCVRVSCHSAHVEVSGQLVELVFSSQHMDARDQTTVIRPCGNCFCLPSHFTDPLLVRFYFFNRFFSYSIYFIMVSPHSTPPRSSLFPHPSKPHPFFPSLPPSLLFLLSFLPISLFPLEYRQAPKITTTIIKLK